jgi:hypothetical protein
VSQVTVLKGWGPTVHPAPYTQLSTPSTVHHAPLGPWRGEHWAGRDRERERERERGRERSDCSTHSGCRKGGGRHARGAMCSFLRVGSPKFRV